MISKYVTAAAAIATVLLALVAPGHADEAGTSAAMRPFGFTIGIGAGWDLPNDIDNLNTASVRFRLPNGLTLEPRFELSTATDKSSFGATDVENSFSAITLVTTARWPLMGRGPVDLLIVGGAGLEYDKTNPEGSDNNRTNTLFSLIWGVSVEYWYGPRWAFSLTATNPLFTHLTEKDQMVGDDLKDTFTAFGAVWDPDIVAMVHLFY